MPWPSCRGALPATLAAFRAAGPRCHAGAVSRAAEAMARCRPAEDVALSPDGTMVAMVKAPGRQPVVPDPDAGGKVIKSGAVNDIKDCRPSIGPATTMSSSTRARRAPEFLREFENELTQGLIVSVADGGVKPLLRQSQEYLPAVMKRLRICAAGRPLVRLFRRRPHESTRDTSQRTGMFKQRYPDLFRVDLQTGSVQRVTPGTANERDWVLDSTGAIVAESNMSRTAAHGRSFRRFAVEADRVRQFAVRIRFAWAWAHAGDDPAAARR